ncbi:hypothetical protein EVAR_3583_1 [Eumeta japonica]|uniref:Uncharacterized protein n=1 Tax=Eumeta variegata TaxID=151549 RepID=A0A4C1SVH5_EUMVA|nr:hypothetical protein EVAR_3583_1 [Eumeta japonica]
MRLAKSAAYQVRRVNVETRFAGNDTCDRVKKYKNIADVIKTVTVNDLTLPDPPFFSPAYKFCAIATFSWLTSQRQSFTERTIPQGFVLYLQLRNPKKNIAAPSGRALNEYNHLSHERVLARAPKQKKRSESSPAGQWGASDASAAALGPPTRQAIIPQVCARFTRSFVRPS